MSDDTLRESTELSARLLAIRGASVGERQALLQQVVDQGSWRLAPSRVWEAIASIDVPELRSELFDRLATAAAAGVLEDPGRIVLGLLSSQPTSTTAAAETALARFLDGRQPNDAGRVIDAFERNRSFELPEVSEELRNRAAVWLLQHGGSELVTAPRIRAALHLAHYFGSRGDLDECCLSLRLVLANDAQLVELRGELQAQLIDVLRWTAARGERSSWTFQLLAKGVGGLGAAVIGEVIASRGSDEISARLVDALLAVVLCGQLPRALIVQAFAAAILSGLSPPSEEIADARAVEAGVEALELLVTRHRGCQHRAQLDTPRVAAWVEKLSRRVIGHEWPPLTHSRLGLAAGWNESVAEGVGRALRDAWAEAGVLGSHPSASTARELLPMVPEKHAVLALLELARGPQATSHTVQRLPVAELERRVETLVPLVATLRGQTFELLRRSQTRRVRFAGLEDGAKVAFHERELLVDPEGPAALFGLDLDERARLVLIELYVIHELVHVAQEIGDKAVVEAMRNCGRGGETTLMHLDLSADHTAACALDRVRYPGELNWLKEIQGRSIMGFPSGIEHTVASRYRKSLRLVSLRFELAARRAGLVASDDDAPYVFVDFNPAGGTLNLLESRPPIRILGRSVLPKADAAFLSDCVGPETKLEKVDAVVGRLFSALQRPTA